MLEIKQHVLQCLIQSGRPKRKVNSKGKIFRPAILCAGSFRLSPFTESLRYAAKEARPWAQPDECMVKILVVYENCLDFETPPLVDIGGISREIAY